PAPGRACDGVPSSTRSTSSTPPSSGSRRARPSRSTPSSGSAVNNDGASESLTAPSLAAQEEVLRLA
ncbi:MAG TPA: hypothetical protein VFC00_12925, partial [Micromonosporaceae bacterium]|nr:hypothetical protein [Micromonosporaceae bacterium]